MIDMCGDVLLTATPAQPNKASAYAVTKAGWSDVCVDDSSNHNQDGWCNSLPAGHRSIKLAHQVSDADRCWWRGGYSCTSWVSCKPVKMACRCHNVPTQIAPHPHSASCPSFLGIMRHSRRTCLSLQPSMPDAIRSESICYGQGRTSCKHRNLNKANWFMKHVHQCLFSPEVSRF